MYPNFYKKLPETPGVYIFQKNQIPIYVGKAINLKRRVSSYFDLHLEPKTAKMISEANGFKYIKVRSEFEALLLEAKLIKKYKPNYNIAAKDDKKPLYIIITKDKYPRVITARGNGNFGPFLNSYEVYSVLRILRRIFPYSDHKLGKRACLYSHFGLCKPCPSVIKTEEERKIYLKNIRHLKSILNGNIESVRKSLEKLMKSYSEQSDFEKAANIRDQLIKLDRLTQERVPSSAYLKNPNLYDELKLKELKALSDAIGIKKLHRIECYDISHLSGTNPTASMVTFINGEADKTQYRHFRIKTAKGGDDFSSLREVSIRRRGHIETWGKPDLVVIDGGKSQVKSFELDVPKIGIAKRPDRMIINGEALKVPKDALMLLTRMRNEAHRFAQRYHHKLVSKSLHPYAKLNNANNS